MDTQYDDYIPEFADWGTKMLCWRSDRAEKAPRRGRLRPPRSVRHRLLNDNYNIKFKDSDLLISHIHLSNVLCPSSLKPSTTWRASRCPGIKQRIKGQVGLYRLNCLFGQWPE
jgi:hypothetical protein